MTSRPRLDGLSGLVHEGTARAAVVGIVAMLRSIERRCAPLRTSLNVALLAAETWMLVAPATILVLIIDAIVGPFWLIATAAIVWRTSRRTSLRATIWLVVGVYVTVRLAALSSELAVMTVSGDVLPEFEPLLGAASLALLACSASVLVLVVALPLAHSLRRYAPELARTISIWTTDVGRGAIAGLALGAGVGTLMGGDTTVLVTGNEGSRLLFAAIGFSIGAVCGALHADLRARRTSSLAQVRRPPGT